MTTCPRLPDRTPSEGSQVHERLEVSFDEKMNLCTAAAPITNGNITCFALSEHSIPAAPALRMPACGGRVGVKVSQGGSRRGGLVLSYGFNILRDKDGMRAGTLGTGAPQKNEDCKDVDIGHRTESLRTRYRCRISCAATSVNTLRWCAACAMGAAADGAYGGDIPGSYSLAHCPVGADRA